MEHEGKQLHPLFAAIFTLLYRVFLIKKGCLIKDQIMIILNIHLIDFHKFVTSLKKE